MKTSYPGRVSQHGVALVVALILLAIMTLLGLALLRATLLDERMSGLLYDRSLALQSAEAGLREAEARISVGGLAFPDPGQPCNDGLCPQIVRTPGDTIKDRWLDTAFTGWKVADANVGAIGVKPDYFVEKMDSAGNWPGCATERPRNPNCITPRYRITARSEAAGRSAILLQTVYADPSP